MLNLLPSIPMTLGAAGFVLLAGLLLYGSRSPIFWVDLVTTSRRTRYFGVRAFYAAVLLFILWASHESALGSRWNELNSARATIQQTAQFANFFYQWFAFVQLLAVTLLTPAMVAGTIATEREGKTIEYLFASDLSDSEIVLGKLATRLAQLVSYLLVALPVVALATLFGGISGNRLVQAFAVSGSMLCSTAGLSLAMSVRARRARDAVVGTYLTLLALLIVPLLFRELMAVFSRTVGGPFEFFQWLFELSLTAHPYVLLMQDLSGSILGGGSNWTPIVVLVGWHALFTGIFVGAAVWGVRREHLRAASAGEKKPAGLSLQLFRPPIGQYPMLWKEMFAESWRLGFASYLALGVILVAILLPTVYWFFDSLGGSGRNFSRFSSGMSTFVVCGLLLILAARAAMSITSERERDTWLSLTSTPMTGSEVVLAKVLGSLYSVRLFAIVLAGIWFLSILSHPQAIVSLPFHIATILVLALFASNLGVLFSLGSSTSLRSMAGTLAVILFLGGTYFCCCSPMFLFGRGPGREFEVVFAPCLMFLIFLSASVHELHGSHEMELFMVYVLGLGMYVIASLVLYASSVASFDRLAGRTVEGRRMSK